MELDRLILGANPLYGADHFSGERARERSLRLNPENVYNVIKAAFSAGATGFNFSPHPLIYKVLERMKNEGYDYPFGLYPMFPDTQTYVNTQLKSGTIGMLKQLLGDLGVMGGAKALLQGGVSWLTTDPIRAMKLYLDIEIKKLLDIAPTKCKPKTILAHEVLTDIALSFESDFILRNYFEHLRDKHKLIPGFVTRNFPRFLEFCTEHSLPINQMVIMTPFNEIGFQMTPSREACEQCLSKHKVENLIAMSILAGGQLNLSDSINYLNSLKKISSVAIGVSTQRHANETFSTLRDTLAKETARQPTPH